MRLESMMAIALGLSGLIFAHVPSALACSVCFAGISDDPANVSLRNGVIFLLAVVLVVLALFAKFFLNIRKRIRSLARQS